MNQKSEAEIQANETWNRNKTDPSRKKNLFIVLIMMLAIFPPLSETIYTPALPNLAHSLLTSSQFVEWTISIYLAGYAAGIGVWGRVADLIGRRKTTLCGIGIYAISTLLCLSASHIGWLFFSRFALALGASVGSVITQTLIRDTFSGCERQKVYSITAISLSTIPAIGPFIGGSLSYHWNWRANFIFLFFTAISLFFLFLFKLPETKTIRQKTYFIDVVIRFFKDPKVIIVALMVGVLNGILFSYYSESPFIFINHFGMTSYNYGLLGIGIACANFCGALISYHLNHKNFDLKKSVVLGLCIIFISALILLIFTLDHWTSIVNIFAPCCGLFMGSGVAMGNLLSDALEKYKDVLGTAGSLLGLSYYFVASITTFFMGLFHNGTLYPMPIYFFLLSFLLLCLSMCAWTEK